MLSLDEKRILCATRNITLNGQPATLSGAQLEFATVRALDPDLPLTAEWTWSYAANIVCNYGGQFFTSREARHAYEQAVKNAKPTKTKPIKQPAKQAPVIDLTADQLDMLITAAAHEVDWYRNSNRADKADRIAGLEQAIAQLQASRNFKQGYY